MKQNKKNSIGQNNLEKSCGAVIFKVIDGEKSFTIGVSEEVYYDMEINDSITLSIYKGAFNEPYYIHENLKE